MNPQRPVVAASILAADLAHLADAVSAAAAGGVDWIHLDVMDGHFVPNLGLGPDVTAAVRKLTDLPLDVHLMVSEPERWIEPFARAGADRIGVQAEAATHLHRTLQQIREAGLRPSVVLNPATPPVVLDHVLDLVDMILVMTVNPGFSGQDFLPAMLAKVRRCRAMIADSGRPIRLAVDGGVEPGNVSELVAAGADVLVAGSAIFGSGDPAAGVRRLRAGIAAG